MKGRIEHKILNEEKIKNKIETLPIYISQYYYSMNLKTSMTKTRYMNAVIRFLNHISNNNIREFDISTLDTFIIEKYINDINYYNKNGDVVELSNDAKNMTYSAIKSFTSFLLQNNYIHEDPFAGGKIKHPKIKEKEITFLNEEEIKKIERVILKEGVGNQCAISKQQKWKYRDYLIFRIPIINGLRVTALNEININDINFESNYIEVTEKGNIDKKVYFDNETKRYLFMWLRDREDILSGEQCDALFISNRKKRMTVQSMEDVVKKYSSVISDKHITPHKLRSTCGTNLYQNTHDIYLVADVLGHKSTSPTKRYVKVMDSDKKNAVDLLSKSLF